MPTARIWLALLILDTSVPFFVSTGFASTRERIILLHTLCIGLLGAGVGLAFATRATTITVIVLTRRASCGRSVTVFLLGAYTGVGLRFSRCATLAASKRKEENQAHRPK